MVTDHRGNTKLGQCNTLFVSGYMVPQIRGRGLRAGLVYANRRPAKEMWCPVTAYI
jgi:hypothetical protein